MLHIVCCLLPRWSRNLDYVSGFIDLNTWIILTSSLSKKWSGKFKTQVFEFLKYKKSKCVLPCLLIYFSFFRMSHKKDYSFFLVNLLVDIVIVITEQKQIIIVVILKGWSIIWVVLWLKMFMFKLISNLDKQRLTHVAQFYRFSLFWSVYTFIFSEKVSANRFTF